MVAVGQHVAPVERNGALLYSTYCIGCHTTQVHWREHRLVKDWTSLNQQVRRWQENVAPGLDDADVAAMAKHLNGLYYHLPEPSAT